MAPVIIILPCVVADSNEHGHDDPSVEVLVSEDVDTSLVSMSIGRPILGSSRSYDAVRAFMVALSKG